MFGMPMYRAGGAAIDHRDVLLPEANKLEELDRSRSVRDCDGHMIGVANHQHHLLHQCAA
jgi:hypothetical protein